MRPIHLPPLNDTQFTELDTLYRKTKDPRLRTRTQIILLSAEQERKGPEIAGIVRESEATVLRWLKRYRLSITTPVKRWLYFDVVSAAAKWMNCCKPWWISILRA